MWILLFCDKDKKLSIHVSYYLLFFYYTSVRLLICDPDKKTPSIVINYYLLFFYYTSVRLLICDPRRKNMHLSKA